MVTTIPTAIPPPKVPPLNLDVVVVVLGVCVVDVDVVWDVVLFVGVVGFVLVVDVIDVAWDVVLFVGVVGFVLVLEIWTIKTMNCNRYNVFISRFWVRTSISYMSV